MLLERNAAAIGGHRRGWVPCVRASQLQATHFGPAHWLLCAYDRRPCAAAAEELPTTYRGATTLYELFANSVRRFPDHK